MDAEQKKMIPNITVTDVRVLPGDSAFLLYNSQTAILYDTGFGFTGDGVAEKIKAVLGERKLDYIFLTHSHYDHALGSVRILHHFPNAKVVAGEYAAHIFTRPGAKAVMRKLDEKFARKNGISDYKFHGDGLKVDIPVKDGDVITAGDFTFEAVALPGHTKCSFGYYLREEKLLLSCETLGIYSTAGIITPSFLVGIDVTRNSINKIKNYDIKHIVTPHYGLLDEKQTEFYLHSIAPCLENAVSFFAERLEKNMSLEDIIEDYRIAYCKFKNGDIYPTDAMVLNTSIMIDLVKKEHLGRE